MDLECLVQKVLEDGADTAEKENLGQLAARQQKFDGISFPELYQRCRESFLVNSDLTLRAQLTEYKDHKLISVKRHSDGIDYLTIPLKKSVLLEFKDIQEENA